MKKKYVVILAPLLGTLIGCSTLTGIQDDNIEKQLCEFGVKTALYEITGGEKQEILYTTDVGMGRSETKQLAEAVRVTVDDKATKEKQLDARKIIADQCIVQQKLKK